MRDTERSSVLQIHSPDAQGWQELLQGSRYLSHPENQSVMKGLGLQSVLIWIQATEVTVQPTMPLLSLSTPNLETEWTMLKNAT